MIDIRQETPIASFSILAYLCWKRDNTGMYLVLKRSSSYLTGTWQPISGRIEKGEKAWEAALREIKEETGLTPDRFYSTNQVESFYAVDQLYQPGPGVHWIHQRASTCETVANRTQRISVDHSRRG